MRKPFLERIEWLFPLRGRWLQYLLQALLVGSTLGLWGACLFRATRFWYEAHSTFAIYGGVDEYTDLSWARIITVAYLICAGIGAVLLLGMRRRGWALLGILHTLNLLSAAWLTLEQPERGIVHTFDWEPLQALAANLLMVGIAGMVGLARAVVCRRRRLHSPAPPTG